MSRRWAAVLIAGGALLASALPTAAATPAVTIAGAAAASAPAHAPARHRAGRHQVAVHQQQLQAAAGSVRQGTAGAAAATPIGGAWTELGPRPITGLSSYGPVSGRVTALAANGSTVYAGASDGGVWRSTDAGANWVALTDNNANVPTLAIGALAVDWTTQTIYAGTGEANHCQDCLPSQGVLISKDAGATWTLNGQSTFTASAFAFAGLAIDRTNTQTIVAATNRGLYRSIDGGTTWNAVAAGAGRADEVIQDPSDATKFWTAQTTSCSSPSVGTIGSWSTTTNTWTQLWPRSGQPSVPVAAVRIGLGVGASGTAYAAVAACQVGLYTIGQLEGVLKTTTGGSAWQSLSGVPDYFAAGSPPEYQGWYDNVIGVDPLNPNDAVFGGITLLTTINGGSSFADVAHPYSGGPVHPDFHAVAFTGGRLYVGNDGGVWSSADLGQSWSNLNATLAITQFYSGTALDFSQVTAGSQDNGTAGIVTGGPAAPTWQSLLDGDGGWTAMTRNTPTFFAEGTGLDMFRINYSTGQQTEIAPSCPSPYTASTCFEPTGFIAPFVMDPNNINPPPPNVAATVSLYAGTYRVYATNDAGNSWGIISGDLTTDTGTAPNTHPRDFINTMSIGAGNSSNTVVTASWFGKVFMNTSVNTSPGSWNDITGNLPGYSLNSDSGNAWITGVVVNPLDNTELWVTIGTVSGQRVWHTTTAGSTWTDISSTLPANLVVDSIAVDPIQPQNIYIGTDAGVMICQLCGGGLPVNESWAPLGTNLPNVRVDAVTLTADAADVVTWTHGRGAWFTPVPITRPGADLSPSSADFGTQNVGTTSLPKNFTLSNNGSAPLAITGIDITGDTSDFTQTNGCGAALAPGSTCTISVTFHPTAISSRSGALSVRDNAADSPQMANLVGTGGDGYWLVARDGGIFTFGSVGFFGSTGGIRLNQPIVGMARTSTDRGYWLVAADGGVFTFGDARFFGSEGGHPLNKPVVGMAPTPDDQGYWLVASDGGIFTHGDAGFFGSEGGRALNKPIVGMASTPDGNGYWMVASDGGIFTHGDAAFFGSEGGRPLNKPIVGMAATRDGGGYWLVASDGGIFTHGDAGFFGSEGGSFLFQPIVGMAATRDSGGYWLVASDGGVFRHGDASFYGSMGGQTLNQPMVGMAGS